MNRPESMIKRIIQMHEKFNISADHIEFSENEKKFRIVAMQEELYEYEEADTPEDNLDALVDLVVFAIGTAERMGMIYIFEEAYNRVMTANMQKEVGENAKRGSFAIDLIKPEGWEAPDHSDLFQSDFFGREV